EDIRLTVLAVEGESVLLGVTAPGPIDLGSGAEGGPPHGACGAGPPGRVCGSGAAPRGGPPPKENEARGSGGGGAPASKGRPGRSPRTGIRLHRGAGSRRRGRSSRGTVTGCPA